MTDAEYKLLEELRSYTLIKKDIKRLEERLERSVCNITPNYSFTGGGSGSFQSSKTEMLAIRRMDTERELKRKRDQISRIDLAVMNAGLNKREKDLVLHTINGNSLSSYARQENIYKSYVYKIRDNALKKMVNFIQKAQNERNSR